MKRRELRAHINYTPTTYDMVAALQFFTGQTWDDAAASLQRWRDNEGSATPLDLPEEPE